MGRRLLELACVFGILLAAYAWERTWMRNWGATDREVQRTLIGDDVMPLATEQGTRAITIAAPIERVWPWLAQIGQDRGGFYSYEVLQNLVGCRIRNANRILPWAQHWRPGDSLWMVPRERAGGAGGVPLVRFVPGRALVFAMRHLGSAPDGPRDGTWAFVLEPRGPDATRLLVRGRGGGAHILPAWTAFDRVVFEPVVFAMERRMMTGLRDRAEGHVPWALGETLQVLLWTVAFVFFWASVVQAIRRPRAGRVLVLALAWGGLFQLLTFVQPHLALGIPLVLVLVGIGARPARAPSRPRDPVAERRRIDEFLAGRRIALVGLSAQPQDFSRAVLRELVARGYDVVPVRPGVDEIDGRRVYPRLQDVPGPIDGALVMTPPHVTDQIVRDCVEAGVSRVWLHRGVGQGSVSETAIQFAETHGLSVVAGQCPLMFLPDAAAVHRFHGALLTLTGRHP